MNRGSAPAPMNPPDAPRRILVLSLGGIGDTLMATPLLAELRRARGLTLIIATHDASVAADADRIVRMRDGRIEGVQ